MFRENEASRVGAVLEHKAAGNRDGMLEAAAELWRELPERDGDVDNAERDVWNALVEQGLTERAASLGERIIRDRQRIRPAAFVHIVEAMEPSRALDLAAPVLAAGWAAQPYLAAVLACAIDARQEDAVAAFLRTNTAALNARLDTWILTGFVLTSSRVGKDSELASWFENWESRQGVPMWLVAAYLVAMRQAYPTLGRSPHKSLVAAARVACEHAVPDVTSGFFTAILLIELLANGQLDEFVRELAAREAELTAFVQTPLTEYPVVRYANAAREMRPVGMADLSWEPPQRREIRVAPRPVHWFMAVPIRDLRSFTTIARTQFGLFDRMVKLERGDRAVMETCKEMERARPSSIPALQPVWKRLVHARTTLGMRLRMALG